VSLSHHSDRPLKLVRQILETLYGHPANWVSVEQVAGMMDAPIEEEFQTALGFAASTDLLLVDDTCTPVQVCLTPTGVVLAQV
jgi:hypothetical protein